MSSPDTSMPDSGLIEGMNTPTAPQTITSDSTQSSIPMPDGSTADPGTQAAADQQPQQQQAPQAAPKPSLWKSVLMGALQGMAAGSAVNTRGMSTGSAIAAGLGAGANQTLNVVPQQKSQLDMEKAQTATHYANLSKIQREVHLMPDDKQEEFLNNSADQSESMLKSGAITPLSQPSDLITAQKQLQTLHGQNPWAVYSVMPVRGADGNIAYSAVQFGKAPLQSDLKLAGGGDDGKDITIPAGTPADQVGKYYSNYLAKQLDAQTKTSIADNHNTTALAIQDKKGAQAAAKAANAPNANMMVGSLPNGDQVAGTPEELKAAGVSNYYKLPAADVSKTTTARGLIAPGGTFSAVAADVADLQKRGQLGAAASRWNDFLTGKVGTGGDKMFAKLSTDIGLLQTAIMQAHVGAKGSSEMMEHFKQTVGDPTISDATTLLARLGASYDYMRHKAMLIPTKKAGN